MEITALEAKMEKGTKVRLTKGTRVGLDSGEKFEWGGTKYDWMIVGEFAEGLEDVVWQIESKTGPHATMNGGGFDYRLIEVISGFGYGVEAIVRTSFSRNERATFEAVA